MAMRNLAVLIALIIGFLPTGTGVAGRLAGVCEQPGTILIAEQDDRVVAVEPATGNVRHLAIDPRVVEKVARARRLGASLMPSRWQVERTADERGRRIQVFDSVRDEQMLDELFELRIELAMSSVSSSGQYTVYLQSNNIASDVTILDAANAIQRTVGIVHDAPLAAYAMAIVFSPDQHCAAISMERIGGDGAETWLLDLATGGIATLPVADVLVLDWVPGQV
jgi:hypothetical protein